MKLITLNTWTGKVFGPLMEFVKTHAPTTDIFCFQEITSTPTTLREDQGVRVNLLQELQRILPTHTSFYSPVQDHWLPIQTTGNVLYDVFWGQAIFVKKSIPLTNKGEFFTYGTYNHLQHHDPSTLGRSTQYISFVQRDKRYTILNLHGYWNDGPKVDTPERLQQSKTILNFLQAQKGEVLICGDFNLNPDTKSLELLAHGMTNLVKEYHIPTTRSSFYDWPDKFADYILVSKSIVVKQFCALPDEVSDHLALSLEFL